MNKLTRQSYETLAVERGFLWIGQLPQNTTKYTIWRCSQGHEWEASYGSVKIGNGCPHCSGHAKRIPSDYAEIAAKNNLIWLGPIVNTSHTKTSWQCNNGHVFSSCYTSIQQGHSCPYCVGKARKFAADYETLAKDKGLLWVGDVPTRTTRSTKWKCVNGHIWTAAFNDIQSGHGCPYCAGNGRKKPNDYLRVAKDRNIVWIGEFPPNNKTKTEWECLKGHRWSAHYNSIQSGRSCPVCRYVSNADNHRLPESEYVQIAQTYGLNWIGPYTGRIKDKTEWGCPYGHRWFATLSNIKNGSSCPFCLNLVNGHKVSKPQLEIHKLLGGEINYRVGKYSIDVAIVTPDIKIAIEYDCWYWHKNKLIKEIDRDRYLNKLGWRILRIKTEKQIPTREQLEDAINSLIIGNSYVEIILPDWGLDKCSHNMTTE